MKESKKSTEKPLLSFDKLLIFPLCITYILINVITILNYPQDMHIYYKLWRFCKSHDILDYFYWFYNTGENLAMHYNHKISVVLILMMITDIVFSITNGRKPFVKWILYGIMTLIILFIGFVASPEFYDSV